MPGNKGGNSTEGDIDGNRKFELALLAGGSGDDRGIVPRDREMVTANNRPDRLDRPDGPDGPDGPNRPKWERR